MFNPELLGCHSISFSLQIFVSEEYGFVGWGFFKGLFPKNIKHKRKVRIEQDSHGNKFSSL